MIVSIFRYMLHPVFKWVYKDDFESYEAREDMFVENCSLKNKELEELKSTLGKYQCWDVNMAQLLREYKYNVLSQTPNGETVVISYSSLNMFTSDIVLSHLRTTDGVRCCKMGTSMRENQTVLPLLKKAGVLITDTILMTTISDICCSSEYRGHAYATTLLSFALQEARQQNIKYIGGWLCSGDFEYHIDLKRLYERLGFDVYLFPDITQGVIIQCLK
ncbi:GNAT family N-acetyltransferase [Bacteroides uniformis]|uniref:GNAT family N-acetyltransferase n=1 Tax=Bacteroides uniformis TaxID=820 RepID=UPI00233F5610|nr:GNAT family N-acetyltransferase [Bacteroides uniformis]MDC1809050.1 GNAT family N-acetyltransferase [Bacteroides uniformis]